MNIRLSPTPARHESPSLSAAADPAVAAYELKFLLTESAAAALGQRLRDHLAPDPHADPTLGNAYRVTSVYCDTPRFDVYRRTPGFRTHKFRLRRYGDGPTVFLERKSKQGDRVWKRRTAATATEVTNLADAADWRGAWFARELTEAGLSPVCRVTYERTAFVGASPDGAIRVTLDRAARGLASSAPHPEPFAGGLPLLHGEVVVEFKYLVRLPALFKDLIGALRLSPASVSKYRRCAAAAGLVAGDVAYA